ncbi:MAG: hypothetical protein JJU45_18885 [Acidimicrobiia bacterium]|nr:hypothetical protein [Acidimicrobiia bacterium]
MAIAIATGGDLRPVGVTATGRAENYRRAVPGIRTWNDAAVVELLREAADAVVDALAAHGDWGPSGRRPGQYASDLVADEAVAGVLDPAGVGVLSEESGRRRPEAEVTVVVDPLDGSTNASVGVPWYATSLCAVDAAGLRAALVVDLVSGRRFAAVRGGGATCDGEPLRPSVNETLGDSLVGLSGYPPQHLGWRQYRVLGAVALDLCAVASGTLDGYVDCSPSAHGAWDYLGGMLICAEAGATVVDAHQRDLVVLDHDARRTPVAAGSPALLDELLAARRRIVER